MILGKTVDAFIWSTEYLFEAGKPVYFWTFTFAEVMSDRRVGYAWEYMWRDMKLLFNGNIAGIRVFEVHPGGHGLHIHLLVNRFFHVDQVRRLARKHGIGRIDVRQAVSTDGPYLAKYLSKNGPKLAKGVRKWQALGVARRVRVHDVIYDTPEARHVRELVKATRTTKIPYRHYLLMFREAQMAGFTAAGEPKGGLTPMLPSPSLQG